MSHTTIGIPRVLWESLETTLWTHSRKYVRDLAKYLGIKEDVLLKEVLPSKDIMQVYIQDCPEDTPHDMECRALIVGGSEGVTYALRCRKTVQLGSVYCCTHHLRRIDVQPALGDQTRKLYRICDTTAEEQVPLWADEQGSVWDANACPRGYYDKDTMQLYLSS